MADTEIQSLLPNLEPVLGVAFALCLAYIGLARFRYRSEIRNYVRELMGDLVNAPKHIAETGWFKGVARLSSLGDYDRRWPYRSDKNAQLAGAWSVIYEKWFECHQDRCCIISSAIICAVLMLLGVAHTIGLSGFEWSKVYFTKEYITLTFYANIVMMALPVASVIAGRFTVKGAKGFAGAHVTDLKAQMKANVQKANVPTE